MTAAASGRTPPTPKPDEATARYAGFWTKLDCDICGDEIEVEGDISNGETVHCDQCDEDREVRGR